MNNINKLIRDGKVGIIISPSYGGGFYSWGAPLEAIFDPKLIELVENLNGDENDPIVEEIKIYLERTYDDPFADIEDLVVVWIEEGQKFIIDEYDGAESIVFIEDLDVITA